MIVGEWLPASGGRNGSTVVSFYDEYSIKVISRFSRKYSHLSRWLH